MEHTFLMDRAKMLPKGAGVNEQKTHFGYERMLSPRQALPVRLTLGEQPAVLKESKQLALGVPWMRGTCQNKHIVRTTTIRNTRTSADSEKD